MVSHHGCVALRGIEKRLAPEGGRFGRLFPKLSPCTIPSQYLEQLGEGGGPMDEGTPGSIGEAVLPVGFVFLGQFIDHDITLDVTSSLGAAQDPDATHNFRTPALDLDCVYGGGPEASPHLYDGEKMLLGDPGGGLPSGSDLPRNSAGTALIGDPRNDENRIVSQLQLAFLKFHNAVVDHLQAAEPSLTGKELFERARESVRWHYQWMVLHDFLPRICGRARLRRILGGQRKAGFHPGQVFMPVEFSVAAYRFGHSQVPGTLATNNPATTFSLFSSQLGMGFTAVDDPDDLVDWQLFFQTPGGTPQRARKIDSRLATTLLELPANIVGGDAGSIHASLAVRNLKRGQVFGLPSGQAVADAMGIAPLSETELWPESLPAELRLNLRGRAPLWYYILKEADVQRDGEKLGRVGAHIVAEVIVGLIERDPTAFLGSDPNWRPVLPRTAGKPADDFDMEDLLAFAGLLP